MKNNRNVIDYLQTAVFSYLTHEQKLLLGPYFYDAVSKHKTEIIDAYKQGFDDGYGKSVFIDYLIDGEHYYKNNYEK